MIKQFCDWLSITKVSVAFQSAEWFVPLVQTIHIICIAGLIIPVLQICNVLIRRSKAAEFSPTIVVSARRVWPLLITLLVTGVLLTITEPARELLNWTFRIKMALVAALALIICVLGSRIRRNDAMLQAPRLLNVTLGLILILLVVAIITAGRWIAYT